MSKPLGSYTPIVRAGPWLITSGQLGLDPLSDPPALVAGGAGSQLAQALLNAGQLLLEAGAAVGDVVKTLVFVTDIDDYADVNAVYAEYFGEHRPARSVVAVSALPLGATVEVEIWAYRPGV